MIKAKLETTEDGGQSLFFLVRGNKIYRDDMDDTLLDQLEQERDRHMHLIEIEAERFERTVGKAWDDFLVRTRGYLNDKNRT